MIALIKPFGMALAVWALAVCALAACNGEQADSAAQPAANTAQAQISTVANDNVDPDSGLEVINVTVTTAEGEHVFRTEIAATEEQKARGMMFRDEMAPDTAMLFPYDEPRDLGFWMRNTFIPLDIIFIDSDGTIINIEDGVPFNEDSVFGDAPAVAVLELLGGTAEELGIAPGDAVSWAQ